MYAMMNLRGWRVIAILTMASLLSRSMAEFLTGTIRTSEEWTFLARFCFLSDRGQLSYTFSFPREFQPVTLLMYYDEATQWPSVYKKGLSCMEMISPPHILMENNQAVILDVSQFWSGCEVKSSNVVCDAQRTFKSARERWWYLALSRCQNSTVKGININYTMLLTNGPDNDLFHHHFSADEFYILEVDIVFLLAMFVLFVLAIIAAVHLWNRQLLHTTYKMFMTSLFFDVFYLFIMCIGYGQYADNGKPNPGVRTFARVSEVIGILIFILMLLLMGKGFTITRGRISTSGSIKIAIFMTLYTLTYAILFFYQATFFDPGLVLYLYESPPGYGILVLRLLAWVYFSYACFFTLKHYPEKGKFYYPFYIFYSIWFLIGPLFVIIAYVAWPKYQRSKIVNGIDNGITFLAHSFLLFLTRPSNSNKNFPFHVRTSQIDIVRGEENENEMDKFSSHAYAASSSSNYSVGPDFTSLFSVAKNVYQNVNEQGNQSDSNSSSPSQPPYVTRQPRNGRVPIDKFPHEIEKLPQTGGTVSNERVPDDQVPLDQVRERPSDPFVTTRH